MLKTGDAVRVAWVGSLPRSLIGRTGNIHAFLAPDLVEVAIDDKIWGLQTSQLQPAELSPSLRLWHVARLRHYRRIILKLSRNAERYAHLIASLHQEQSELLTLLSEDDQDTDF